MREERWGWKGGNKERKGCYWLEKLPFRRDQIMNGTRMQIPEVGWQRHTKEKEICKKTGCFLKSLKATFLNILSGQSISDDPFCGWTVIIHPTKLTSSANGQWPIYLLKAKCLLISERINPKLTKLWTFLDNQKQIIKWSSVDGYVWLQEVTYV